MLSPTVTIVLPIEPPLTVTARRATVRDGAERYRLMAQAQAAPRADLAEQFIAVAFWPALRACSHLERDLTLDEFLALPEDAWDLWTNAVRSLNPRWFDEGAPDPKAPSAPATSSTPG